MSDEVDDLLRRTMATLDRQVPDGYFDTLVSRALARLDDPALAEPMDPRGDEPHESHDEDAPPASSSPAATATDPAAVMPGPRAPSNRRPIVAVVGLGLAAAAGATIFVGTRDKTASAPELVARGRDLPEAPATNSAPVGVEPKATATETVASGSAPAVEHDTAVGKIAKKPIATKGRGKGAFSDEPSKLTDEPTKFKNRPPGDTPGEGKPGGSAPWVGKTVPRPDGTLSAGKPSKQGVRAPGDKPELDPPSLPSDIERGMTAVAAKAKACFAGTQGTATVQLTVAPSGRVQKAAVTGGFAGTPTGTCVEQAVRAATFSPFDGEPQSFAYDYLISH